jgi:uncharacterized membrane protein (UPF0127 family)
MATIASTCRTAFMAVRLAFIMLICSTVSACTPSSTADGQLTIETPSGGQPRFNVELAVTGEQRARGLMMRTGLAANSGMLFDFGSSQDVSMWMKNTYLPLDMIFIRQDGHIHRIESNTVPHSTRIIASGGAVRFVLEVPGGTAEQLRIRPGDVVRHPLIIHGSQEN